MKHPLLLKLMLMVCIFNINLSTTRGISQSDEYMNKGNLFEEKEAIRAMATILTQISRYELLMITIEDDVRQTPNHEKLHSLMQSILIFNG
jgi:hypothetical protein